MWAMLYPGDGIDPVEGLEKHPVVPKTFGYLVDTGAESAVEAIGEFPAIVAGVRMIKASLALQRCLAARRAMSGQRDRQQGVSNCAGLP